ncbi:aminotransferase class I/II-fold pyridoxal phosphate-dependent enzyme [Bacillus sp. AGMB 02131]|uniref:Aminotransferase class I/II-fold pyridoxal phosphate-dependent enzyme n=1 Tax=Peribacillus faecalis TaxID=2772559 RepID=A0A927CZC2_9BACI|nr:aminotransferase class I/II-fold pyridoxal phosphate-dependent enzyme [Peribacillus faecalis]MBD3109796.1 aminotransferase class I/II-fold pyridoxal phosphate-dependent enzyme [Peribacillus faecalis]
MNIETRLAQAGVKQDPQTGAISTPIYLTSTFEHPEFGRSTGFDYSRTANPTRKVLEEAIAALEEGHSGFAFSSGMAAITSVLFLFKPGDHLVISDDLYGGTYRLIEQVFKQYDISASYVDTSCLDEVRKAITDKTAALFIETPTNPLMKITDLKAISEIAKEHNLLTIVDNTFLTPYLQKPIRLGADIVIHSGTKYLGGHNDVIAGLVVTATEELSARIVAFQNGAGAILSPFDSWLLLRGMKTLALRVEQQQKNAAKIADFLAEHELVKKVYYPGLATQEQKAIMNNQSNGFGGMLSFEVKNQEVVKAVLKHVNIISYAESLGGVETLITYPATQTHADIPVEIREARGITEGLLRLSVGIENTDDLIGDLKQALQYSTVRL